MIDAERRIVAVVDDDRAIRESVQFLLEVAGYAVETFASAAEFLKSKARCFACLILDHHMPNMTGLELAERLGTGGSAIPILLITGSPSPSITARAAVAGVVRVLEKPFEDDDLLNFVKAAAVHQ